MSLIIEKRRPKLSRFMVVMLVLGIINGLLWASIVHEVMAIPKGVM